MQCRDVRELADSYLSGQLMVETNHELLRHLDSCPVCRSEIEARSLLRSAIKNAFTRAESLRMGDEFKKAAVSRLRATALSNGRSLFPGSWRHVAAAIALLAVVGAGFLLLAGRATAAERDAAGDHRDCAILMRLNEKPIFLADASVRYDPAFQWLQNTPADAVVTHAGVIQVVRRHSCEFNGRRFAHIIVQFQGQLVSLLVTGDDHQASNYRGGVASEPRLEWLPSVNGFNIVSFKTPGHIVFLVSALQKPLLDQVATSLGEPVYRRLMGDS